MIKFGEPQHLGPRAYILIFLRISIPAFGFFLVALLLTVFHSIIIQEASNLILANGGNSQANMSFFTNYITNMIFGSLCLGILLITIGYIVSKLIYINYIYTLGEFELRLRKGILNIEEVSIPYRQMQDININRNIAYRILGVSEVIIDSAGHEEPGDHNQTEVKLEPIDKGLAEQIRDLLQRKIGVQVVEDQKEADREMLSGTNTPTATL